MSIREYYQQNFREDLALMFRGMDARDVRYRFGNDWMRQCSLLPQVPEAHRPLLLVCLYFTVLVDQAMHSHFFQFHRRFEELTHYPKFLVGFGHEAHLSPLFLFQVPIRRGLVSESSIRELIPDGMQLFVEETNDFFGHHMREVTTEQFFQRLLADTDAVVPYTAVGCEVEPLSHLIGTELRKAVANVTTAT